MTAPAYKWTPERRPVLEDALRSSRTATEAAAKLGCSTAAVRKAAEAYGISPRGLLGKGAAPEVEVAAPPDPDLPIEEIIALREKRYELAQKNADARKLIDVWVKDRDLLPIGILHHGDPHIDSPGCDLRTLFRHADLIRDSDGVWATSIGDQRDNWIGRLARIYEDQGLTGNESWRLTEHWIKERVGRGKWLYLLAGNHDLWSGTGDPMKWIAGQLGALYQSTEARIRLRWKGHDAAPVAVNARHDFEGSSMWNTGHGPLKALTLGVRDDIAICGHRHTSGYNLFKDPETGRLCHAIRIASYKRHDRYQIERGFRDQTISPCAFTTIEPRLPPPHPDRIKLWHDPEEGAAFLAWARKRKRAAA